MKCIIDIDIDDIVSVQVPERYKNFKIQQFERAGDWLMETDSRGLNHWKVNMPRKTNAPRCNYEILGFAKDVFVEDFDTSQYKNFILRKVHN